MNKKAIIISIIAIVFFGIFIQETDVTANEVFVQRGDTIEISGRLLENITYGNPVPDQILEFYDQTENRFLGDASTDADGYATITWTVPINHTLGPTILNVTFQGNESLFLAPSCQLMLLTILSQTDLQVHVREDDLAPYDYLEVDVIVFDDELNPLQNAILFLCIDDTTLMITNTNSTGHGHFSVECNDTWLSYGENTISIIYDYDLVNYHSRVVESFLIIYDKISTSLIIQGLPSTTLLNQTHTIDIQFWSESSILYDVVVDIQVNGEYLDTITVNNSVSKHYDLIIDKNFELGLQKISFMYSGTPRYSSAIIEWDITVLSPVYLEVTIDQYPIINSNQTISIDMKDLLHRQIPKASIVVTDLSTGYFSVISSMSEQTYVEPSFPLYGDVGPRTLLINITRNDFLTNNSLLFDFVVWTRPEIMILESNIISYASPSQHISLHIQLINNERSCSSCQVTLEEQNGSLIESRRTDDSGSTVFLFSAPAEEGTTSVIVSYIGDIDYYELPCFLFYNFSVSMKIPFIINSLTYSVIPALQEIQVQSHILLLNGSYPTELNLEYRWIDVVYSVPLSQDGTIFLHLVIPTIAGNHTLQYWIEESVSTYSLYGETQIELDEDTILASQGVGIPAMVITAICTTSIAAIPVIRRWYLAG